MTLHMDGKKYDEEGVFKERVPMCVSGFANGGDHLLEIPLVNDGKAKTLAKKVIFFPSIYLFIYQKTAFSLFSEFLKLHNSFRPMTPVKQTTASCASTHSLPIRLLRYPGRKGVLWWNSTSWTERLGFIYFADTMQQSSSLKRPTKSLLAKPSRRRTPILNISGNHLRRSISRASIH